MTLSLLDRLNQDMKQAMKDKDSLKLSTIRMLRSAIKNKEIDKRRALTDAEVEEVILSEVKKRNDSVTEYEKAGRQDLADKEKAEIEVLKAYLPEQLSEDEVRALVEEVIRETGASSKADMGKVMGVLMPKVKGRADGRLVNRLVTEALSQ
jgi:uncharacterized protein YqeY